MATAYGFDTDNFIYNVASSARNKFGTGVFYVRYENPSPVATHLITSSSAVAEFRSGWDNGVRYFVPNTEPLQSRLNGTAAMGTSDAQAFCAAVSSIYFAVGPLLLPTSQLVDSYLSLEYATNMSTAYWNAWATYVDGFVLSATRPLMSGMYCAPNSPARNCSAVAAGHICWSVWSSTPEPCAACGRFGTYTTWAPNYCSSGTGGVHLWQMCIQTVGLNCCGCGSWPNVDADKTPPTETETNYMFRLIDRP
jgi:hypothetical protein